MDGTEAPRKPCPDLKQGTVTAASLLAHSQQLIPRSPPWLWDKGELLRTDYVIQICRDQNIQTEATSCEIEVFQGKQVSCQNVYTFCSREARMVRIVWDGLLRQEEESSNKSTPPCSGAAFRCLNVLLASL